MVTKISPQLQNAQQQAISSHVQHFQFALYDTHGASSHTLFNVGRHSKQDANAGVIAMSRNLVAIAAALGVSGLFFAAVLA